MSKKQEILEVCSRLFYKQGFNNTALSEILEECGVTKPTLYYHFKSKAGLGQAYIAEQERFLFKRYHKWADRNASLSGYLGSWSRMLNLYSSADKYAGCPFSSFANQMTAADETIFREQLLNVSIRWFNLLRDFLLKLQDADALQPNTDPDAVAQEILMIYQGCVSLWSLSKDDQYLHMMATQFQALAARVDREPR